MRIQVLAATMHRPAGDRSLLEKMNIRTDAVIANQCDRNEVEDFTWKGHRIKWLSFAERGVGLNRNNALMRADGDVVLFADDDMVYRDNYARIIAGAFRKHPQADVIVFNLREKDSERKQITKPARVWWHNYLRYGTARVAAKLAPLRINGIFFNQCFGGGTPHCHGEDNLFLTACLRAGLKIYAVPVTVAELSNERPSTWNTGYNEKYLRDQGRLYRSISQRLWKLLCLQDALRRRSSYRAVGSWLKAYQIMLVGGNDEN